MATRHMPTGTIQIGDLVFDATNVEIEYEGVSDIVVSPPHPAEVAISFEVGLYGGNSQWWHMAQVAAQWPFSLN